MPYLVGCLVSVRNEALSNTTEQVGHLVIDAASKDGSVEQLQKWSEVNCDNRVQNYSFNYFSDPDRGQSDGFNKGISRADTEWVCWLNSDDELAPGAIRAFLETLSKQPDADVIYGHVQFIDEQSRFVKKSYHLPYHYSLIQDNVYVPPTSGTFFKRELFVKEPLDPDYHFVMDVEWFLRCGKNLKAVLADHVFCNFRISSQGKTSEMIHSGTISSRHREERERYRRKYIYSRWPALDENEARAKLDRRRNWSKILYNLLKLRYAARYLKHKLLK
jgi:glycosyltransferase involved in cell wall biosynthesis